MEFVDLIYKLSGFANKFLDSFLMLQILYRCLQPKKPESIKRVLWWWIAASAVFTYSIDFVVNMDFFTFLALYMLVGMSFGVICMKGTVYMKVFMALTFTASSILIRFIATRLVHFIFTVASAQNMMFTPLFFIISSLLAQLLLIVLAGFIIRHSVRTSFSLPAQYWIGFILVVATGFLSMVLIRNESGMSFFMSTFIMCNILVVILMLYYLFSRLTREYEEKHSYLLHNKMLELHSNHLGEITETYNNLRGIRHEMRNHIMYMDTLLKDGQYEKLHEHFNSLYYSGLTVGDMIESGNNVVNAILNQKKSYASSKGILMHAQAFLPEHIGVKDFELCAVVSNLVDNAIEACEGIDSPSVWVELAIHKNYISIIVRNPVPGDVLKQNPELDTTKDDKQNHGFGIKIVSGIVDSYDGMLSFEMRDGLFVASAMMKLTPQPA